LPYSLNTSMNLICHFGSQLAENVFLPDFNLFCLKKRVILSTIQFIIDLERFRYPFLIDSLGSIDVLVF